MLIAWPQGAPIGRAFDAYGPTVIITFGAIIYVTSIVITSFATKYYQYILCQGILFAVGVGMMCGSILVA
jgi:hypothetical protein